MRILVLIAMLIGGTASSQLPEFSQQYRQRLGGAIDALEQILADFNRDAAQFGLSFHEAIARQMASADPFINARGSSMAEADARLSRLKMQQKELQEAGPVERLMIFVHGFDPQLAKATAQDYEPAVPVTGAGLLSAASGALAGLLIARFLASLTGVGRRKKSASG